MIPQPEELLRSFTNEQFSICSPPTAGHPHGRSTTQRTRGEYQKPKSFALCLFLAQESTPVRNSKGRTSSACFSLWPWSSATVVFGCFCGDFFTDGESQRQKERCWFLFPFSVPRKLLWEEGGNSCLGRRGCAWLCLLLLLSNSSQVYKFMDINYPHSPALAEASLTWRMIPN